MKLNKSQIKDIIPQRDPILLVDEVLEMDPGVSIKSTFFVSRQMEIFKGHFPENPVLPGVYTVEALAQTSDILLLSFDKYKGKIPYFIGIDGVKFKRKIVPGDTIFMESKISKIVEEKSIGSCEAEAYVDDQLCAIATVTLAMR